MGNTTTAPAIDDETAAKAAELRARAAESRRESARSFEECDTDGFMSQWASDLTARKLELEADLLEAGGALFPALFDLDGNLVAAKEVAVSRPYGRTAYAFGLLPDDTGHGRFTGWFNPSQARTAATARRNDARKGYYVGYVLARAKADVVGGGTGLAGATSCRVTAVRTDGGWSRDVIVVDNGHGDTDLGRWYDIHCDD